MFRVGTENAKRKHCPVKEREGCWNKAECGAWADMIFVVG